MVGLLVGRDLYVANAGDSRCIVCRNGKAVEMSFDHKPEDEPERQRINNAGGRVTQDGRVNGGTYNYIPIFIKYVILYLNTISSIYLT